MYKKHDEFIINKTTNIPYWRYMDFWKFLNLIESSTLFFPNFEMLGDQHEGRIPKKVLELMDEKHKTTNPYYVQNYKNCIDALRNRTLVSSWNANDSESFAMWKMYAKDKLGIAIKSDFESLKNCFHLSDKTIYIGEVIYYNNKKPFYKAGNTFYSFLVKHNYYLFESEVRCITELDSNDKDINSQFIPVDLNILIKEIYISPFADKTGIKSILDFLKKKHKLNFKICVSDVNDNWI